MSLLNTATSGVPNYGSRIVIAGMEGVGKTTLACNAPRSLLVPLEQGAMRISTHKIPRLITSYDEVITLINEIGQQAASGKLIYKTIVFDSASALERLIHTKVLTLDTQYGKKKDLNMETALGAYGKAYAQANILFNDFTNLCDQLALLGINIVLTCHVFASKVLDPANGEYYTWDLQLHSPKNERTIGKRELITQWADMVGFLHEPFFITKGEGESAQRAISNNQGRVLGVDRTPTYVAKNRYGIPNILIPIPRENGWNNLAHTIHQGSGVDVFNRDV